MYIICVYRVYWCAQFFYGAIICGVACAYLEVSPRYSSLFNTIHNTAGAVAGILGPVIVAALTSAYPGVWGWRYVFILTACMSAVALGMWYVYQTSEVVPKLNNPVRKRK